MVRRGLFAGATRRLLGDESGASAVVIGLSMSALLGAAGMAVDVGVWYADRRGVQGAADAAAFSGAQNISAGDSSVDDAQSSAEAVATQYGYTSGTNGVTVTVNSPPTSGSHTSTPGAVEVIIHKPESLFFAQIAKNSASVAARAVAVPGTGGAYCVLAKDSGSATTVTSAGMDLSNGADIDLSQCGAAINTSGSDALVISSGAKFDAKTLTIVGNYSKSNGGQINVTGTTTTGGSPVADPYANVPTPQPNGCTKTNYVPASGAILSPGTYCGGINISNSNSVTMSAGVYVIDQGSFSVAGGAKLDASAGVTIVLTSSTSSNYATMNISNGANVTITAPTSGTTSGIAVMQDRNSPLATVSLAGGSKMNVTGALYFPSQVVQWANGSTNNSSCTQLIAFQVQYMGGSKFGNSCAGTGTSGIGGSSTTLVE